MNALRTIVTFCCLVLGLVTYSQQLPVLSGYYMNPQLSNPANAGLNGNNIFVLNRNQWQNKSKSPETYLATLDGNLKKGIIGFGFLTYNDNINVIGRTGAYATMSYRLVLPLSSILSFGVSGGIEQNRLMKERVNSELAMDLSTENDDPKINSFDGNFGVSWQTEGLNIGIAGFRLFENSKVIVNEGENKNLYDYYFSRHFVGSASYRMDASPGIFSVTPALQVRMGQGFKPETDVALTGNYKDKLFIGAAYRQHYGMDFMAGTKLYRKLSLTYTLALSSETARRPAQYSHEILLGYKLNSKHSKLDSDRDGVFDLFDREPKTNLGCKVNRYGVSLDSDRDHVADCTDKQVNTPFGAKVDEAGIALDKDKDHVIDLFDHEPETPAGYMVDKDGIALIPVKSTGANKKETNSKNSSGDKIDEMQIDTDNDRVADVNDKEPETPHWKHYGGKHAFDASKCIVDAHGIATDSDGDGIMDCMDEEIFSPKGSKVDSRGISNTDPDNIVPEKSVDTDGDGISDNLDLEPASPAGASVDQWGRSPQVNKDPAAIHRIEIEEIDDNSSEWDYYVIIGVFRYYNNLKNYQKYLLKTFEEPSHVLVTDQNYYYAWTKQVSSKKEAQTEVDRLNTKRLKDYIVGNPWLWREQKKK